MPTSFPEMRPDRSVSQEERSSSSIAVLAGGVGGAKMTHGLTMAVPPRDVTVIVNTADDFDHLGLRICPDLDTVMYTLGGIANPVTGWGIDGDTTHVLDAIRDYGGPDWFQLGDRDIATHLLRTSALSNGESLSEVIERLSARLGIETTILPMSDDHVSTMIESPAGMLEFQDYFVRRRQQDVVTGVVFEGASSARPNAQAIDAIVKAETVIISPSNPIVSIGPMLAVDGFDEALRTTTATRIAVSPIIGGKALKGPADRMLATMGHESSALGVARLYAGLIDGFVIDHADRDLAPQIKALGIEVLVTDAVMSSIADRARLAREILQFAIQIRGRTPANR